MVNFTKYQPYLYEKILSHPLKYYFRGSSIAFGIVLTGNIITSLLDYNKKIIWNPRQDMLEDPEPYMSSILIKSMYFGALWPTLCLSLSKDPKRIFVMDNSLENHE